MHGEKWEEQALRHLCAQGLHLVERNYACPMGEIDLIMWHATTLVFIEVRYRKHSAYGTPAESITPAKRRRLRLTARHYLQRQAPPQEPPCRFDVIAISGPHGAHLEWIIDAFD